MIQDEPLKVLSRSGTVKLYKAQEYICYEGQPGTEMYIILKGTVGVYVNGAADKQIEVCRLGEGDFFGEMALMDNQPRAASSVALTNTVCARVGKDKLLEFIEVCPSIAMKVLESLSFRIRKLMADLYKSNAAVADEDEAGFEIPAEYTESHTVHEPPYDESFINPVVSDCPICGKSVEVHNVKMLNLTLEGQRTDGRTSYKECDPLWHSIWSCPHCHYSNFYSRFFAISEEEKENIRQTLEKKHIPTIEKRPDLNTHFDQLVIHYLQAIHINRNGGSSLLIGRLWRNLYWLFDDAEDLTMKKYCAKRAVAALSDGFAANEVTDEATRLRIRLSMADMYSVIGDKDSASKMCDEILSVPDNLLLKKLAYELRRQHRL